MLMKLSHPQVALAPGALLALRGAEGVRIRCLAGRIWITTSGCDADVWLDAGAMHVVRGNGRTVIEAATDATVEVALGVERAAA
jgi:hypothetical protein